jgi:PAS domain S-box-containing protein
MSTPVEGQEMTVRNNLRLVEASGAGPNDRPSSAASHELIRPAGRGESWLVSIVENSEDAIISKDLDGIITSWNRAAADLFGYAAEEAIGQPIEMIIPEDRLEEEPRILAKIRLGEHIHHFETQRRRKDGKLVDISVSISPIKDVTGEIIGAAKIARDITERREWESRQKLLLSEMNHRIRNTLATVQAIAVQTLRSATSTEKSDFNARLQALARAHDLLTLERWNQTSPQDVIARALEAFDEKHRRRFQTSGPATVTLESAKAMMLAMVFHELATNAIKYGALSTSSGQIAIAWEEIMSRRGRGIRLQWREAGGPPVVPPASGTRRQGFGTRLIELSGGKLTYDPHGISCTVEMDL